MLQSQERTTRPAQSIESASNPAALLRCATVQTLTGFSRSHLYALIAAAKFPAPLKLGTRCSRWRAGDVNRWLESVK